MKIIKYLLITMLMTGAVSLMAQNPDKTLDMGMGLKVDAQTSSYSIAEVNTSVLEKNPHIDVSKALYGKFAGLRVTQGTGSSADNICSITLHGRTPLILIDGFPRDIKDVTVSEIETIQVLSDAAASTLYGMRGGNGVVLITTKRGVVSDFKVTVDYHAGISTQFRSPKFADSYTYASSVNQALIGDGLPALYNQNELDAFKSGEYPYEFPDVDWWDQTVRDLGNNHNFRLTFTNGSEKFRHHTVIDYYRDRSMLEKNKDDKRYNTKPTDTRLSIRSNMDVNITKTTLLKLALAGKMNENRGTRFGRNEIFKNIYGTPSAAFPVIQEDGIYGGNAIYGANNPYALLTGYGHEREITTTLLADMTLYQDLSMLTEGLSLEASVAIDNIGTMYETSNKEYRYENLNASIDENGTLITTPEITGRDSEVLGHSQPFRSMHLRNTIRVKAGYDRIFNNKHSINASLLFDYYNHLDNGRNKSGKNADVIANFAYTYDNRYNVNLVYNHSGSAFLPTGQKWADYPAVSAAWTISNEKFMKDSGFNLLKLRASWGLSGYDGNLSHEMWRQAYVGGGSYIFGAEPQDAWGTTEGTLPTVGLVAERLEKANIGLDLAALDNRLTMRFDGFYEKRNKTLVAGSNSISGIIGIDVSQVNEGEYEYKGFDASLGWNDRHGKFHYGINANVSYLETEVLNENQAYQEYDYLYHNGNPIEQCYGLQAIGFFQSQLDINNSPVQNFSTVRPGDIKYRDQNGDNVIDNKDMIRMFGSNIPRFYFGFDLTFGYGGFEIYADFQGLTGKTVNLLDSPLYKPLIGNGNISQTFLDRETAWTPEHITDATMPRLTTLDNANNYRNNSLWYRDGSYIKLRNLMVSYTFPKKMTKFADIKLYVQGTNLFSADNIGFADPEQLGIAYPSTRCYWAGLKFTF